MLHFRQLSRILRLCLAYSGDVLTPGSGTSSPILPVIESHNCPLLGGQQ